MIIKGGFHNTTKTQVRKALKYLGISRSQLERELVEQGATIEDGMIMPLYRWFAMHPTIDDPLDPKTGEMVKKYDADGRDRATVIIDEIQHMSSEKIKSTFERGCTPPLLTVDEMAYLDDEPNPNNSDGLSNADLRERNEHELWRNTSLWT